jgi:hypothetical protein
MTENDFDPDVFAREWIARWNARDLDGVLAHWAERCVFTSPRAERVTGNARVVGKTALRAYWTAALERIPELRFDLEHAGWDPKRHEVYVVYVSTRAGERVRACERMRFDGALVVEGEATYGAAVALDS